MFEGHDTPKMPIVKEGGKTKPRDIRLLILYLVIAGFALFLLFMNLGDRLLWGDEAETANLAVNVTRYGLPKTFDGRNNLGLVFAGNSNQIWLWSPWLQEYLAAASFILFGPTTATARLPFVIVAFAAAILFVFLAYRLFLDHRMALLSAVLLICSDVFVLHARQCRYYSVVVLGQILLIYSVYRLLTKADKWGALSLGVALVLQFYSNYIIVGGNLLALMFFLPFLIRHRSQAIKPLILGLGVFILLTTPWLLYAHPWHQVQEIGREDVLRKMLWYLSEIHFHMVPLIFFLIPIAAYGARRFMAGVPSRRIQKKMNGSLPVKNPGAVSERLKSYDPENPALGQRRGIEYFLWVLIPLQLLFLSLAPGAFLRYLLPLVPVLILLLITLLHRYLKSGLLIYLSVAILSLSNFFSVLSAYPIRRDHVLRLPPVNLIREICTPYTDRLKDVLCFLEQNGQPDQSILVFDPEFPLIFYTGMRIIDGRLLGGNFPKALPDWVFSTSASGIYGDPVFQLPPDITGSYQAVLLDVHDSRRGGSIPEPDLHESFTSPTMTKMVIYRKR